VIGKNNKKLKDLKQGVKVESYSIKKFKFGAASIVIGASIFFGTGVASANEVAASSDSSATNDTNATSGNGDKVPEKINTVSAEKESVASVNKPSSVKEESTKVEVEKKVVDKSLLETSITKLEELLATVNKDKAPASTLSAVNVDLINAKSILENANASQEEVDALVKKLKQQTQIVSSMPKVTTKEKEVKEGANTIANSGSRDLRNGQSMREGTQFRADSAISSGALANIKYFASVDPKDNGGRNTRNDDPEFTKNKTDIKAYYMEDSQGKWIVYDVFFNNDGHKMTTSSYQQQYYFQAPFNIMDPSNTVRDLSFTRYENVGGRRLSDGFQGFKQYGNTATISNPWGQQYKIFNNDGYSFYDPSSGVTRDNQRKDVFKNNQNDPTLNTLTKDKNGNYPKLSYYLGVKLGRDSTNYAMHMHAKIKLKNNITEEEAKAYGRVYAASTTSGWTTNQSYIMGTTGTSLTPKDTTPPTITANGATVIKNEKIVDIPVTAEDNKGGVGMRPNNPIEVTGLPKGLTFTNGKITGTPTGPVGDSTVTIKAYDKNGNMATETITITVKDQASKYNPTGETLTVNQGQPITDDAVKAKVKNYAPGSLTVLSKPSTAKPGNVGNAVVKVTYPDGSTENVNVPVTVLEAPDNQPPTLTISPANQTVVEGEKVTFTLTATDNKVVNIDGKDFTTKYGTRLLSGKATNTNVKITDTEKVTTITITTTAEDVGKTNTITFNASDNAGNKAKPVTFTFNVTPRDTIAPTITAESATVTKNEPITQIPVTAVDNTGGVGMRDKNPIEVSNLPQGLKYANNQITGTPTGAPGNSTVTIKAYDKNGNMATKTIMITVKDQASKYNPTGESLTVNQGQPITDDAVKAKVKNYGPGTLTVQSKPNSTATAGNAGNAVVKVTYPDGSSDTVNVPVTVKDVTGPTIKADSATVTKNEPITPIPVTAVDNTGGVGLRDKNPIEVSNLPQGLKYENGQITGTTNAKTGYYTVRITAYDKNNTPSTKPIRITVQEQASKYNPTGSTLTVPYNHVITDDEVKAKVKNYGPGILTVQSKPSTGTVGNAGNAVVKVTYPDGSSDTVNVPVFVNRPNSDDYTPKYEEGSGKPGTNVEIPLKEENGKEIPTGTTYESDQPGVITVDDKGKVTVTIPADKKPGDKVTGKVTVTYPDGSKEDVPVTVTVVEQDKDIYTPKYEEGSGKPGAKVEIPLTEENGKEIPTGTTYESDQPGVITVDDKGKVTVTIPEGAKPGDKITGEITVTYPDGSKDIVPVEVTVTNQDKDIYTPEYDKENGKPESIAEPKKQENSMAKVEKSTKRLANTGESETNTGLAGLGLAVLGSLLAIAKRRKEEESK